MPFIQNVSILELKTYLCPINDLFSDSVISLFESCNIDLMEMHRIDPFIRPTYKFVSKLSKMHLLGGA